MAIDLSLDVSAVELQNAAHELFEAHSPTSVVREIEAGTLGYQPELWQRMADLGWLRTASPDIPDGGGPEFLDRFALCQEMGRFLVASPFLDTVAVTGDLLLWAGSGIHKDQVLPAIAEGRCIVSLAVIEADGRFGPSGITMSAVRRGDDFVLNGTKLLVGFAPIADYFLCVARTGSANGSGVTAFLVKQNSTDIVCTSLPNVAGEALYAVEFQDVLVPREFVVGDVDDGWSQLSVSAAKAAVLQTAMIIGAGQAVLEMTNQYAKDREQFGVPIGTFQAVQYMVTDVLIDVHTVDLLARQAAYRINVGKPFAREAAIANLHGKRAAAHLHRQAHEVHAGAGFMRDHDLNLFSRRSKYWENNLGDARYHQDQLALAWNL